MQSVIGCIEAIAQLHQKGLQHGDIRADHILLDNQSNAYIWIDFDYVITHPHYDLFSLGNILLQAAGRADTRHMTSDSNFRSIPTSGDLDFG